jgi:cephalosporin hydroxylase
MAMIRFSDEEVFGVDSQEYEILANAALELGRNTPGAVVEIGTRRGGSAKIIMDALASKGNTNRPMFCIDPYGNIDLQITNINASLHYPGKYEVEGDPMSKDNSFATKFDYTNEMRNRVIPSLYYYAFQQGFNFTFFCLEDHEFFHRYADGVPIYQEEKKLINEYAFVFFDGPHTNEAVEEELNFFLDRTPIGGVYVFDDIWMYDHDKFEKMMFDRGFEVHEKKQIKASYIKIK